MFTNRAKTPKLRANNGWMAFIGLEAFAMFDGFEVIHLAGSCASLGIDAGPQGDLYVDAAVVAMGFDGLRDQQNRDADQTETAASTG